MKIKFLVLLFLVCGCFLIGCNGGGGGSNPIAADMQTPVIAGETFVMQLPPLANIIESMSANTGADADNDPVSAKVEWTGFAAGSGNRKSTSEINLASSKEARFSPGNSLQWLYCRVEFFNAAGNKLDLVLHGAIQVIPHTANSLSLYRENSRSIDELIASCMKKLADSGTVSNGYPRVDKLKTAFEKLDKDSATVYEDSMKIFNEYFKGQALVVVKESNTFLPGDIVELRAMGIELKRLTYNGTINGKPITATVKDGLLQVILPVADNGYCEIKLDIDGWEGSVSISVDAGTPEGHKAVAEQVMVKFGEVLNKLPAEWQGDRLGSLVASIKKDYAALTPDEQAEFNQFIYHNQEMFDFSYLDEVDLSLFNGQANPSLRGSETIECVLRPIPGANPIFNLGPKSHDVPGVTAEKAFGKFVLTSNGWKVIRHNYKWIHNNTLLTPEEVDKYMIPRIPHVFGKDGIANKVEAFTKFSFSQYLIGLLRKWVNEGNKIDTKNGPFIKRPTTAAFGVRGSLRTSTAELTQEKLTFANYPAALQILAKTRSFDKADYDENPELKETVAKLKALEGDINRLMPGLPPLNEVAELENIQAKVSDEYYYIPPEYIVSTPEEIARSITNSKVKLIQLGYSSQDWSLPEFRSLPYSVGGSGQTPGYWLNNNHALQYYMFNKPILLDFFGMPEDPAKTLHIRFGCDEPGEHDFSFTLDYQLPGGVRTSLTVDARLTTRVQLRAWDSENNRTTDDMVFSGNCNSAGKLVGECVYKALDKKTELLQNYDQAGKLISETFKYDDKTLRTISLVSGDKYSFEETVSMFQPGNKAYTDTFTAVVKPDQLPHLWKMTYSGMYKRVNSSGQLVSETEYSEAGKAMNSKTYYTHTDSRSGAVSGRVSASYSSTTGKVTYFYYFPTGTKTMVTDY